MPEQKLSTTLQLDAVLSGGYKQAFTSASDLMSDLKKESSDLKKELMKIGKEADGIDKVGESSKELREDMKLLERQIKETGRATEKFGAARSHFRSASIGAKALKADLQGVTDVAKTASVTIGAIGAGAAYTLSPSDELLEFDQAIASIDRISPELDASGIDTFRDQLRSLSNETGAAANEVANQFLFLTKTLGFEGATQTIQTAIEFETATGMPVTELHEDLRTARVSLGVDTPAETREFLTLLTKISDTGIDIGNLDLGDLETLRERTGVDIFGANFQKEFVQNIVFRGMDSFQFSDHAAVFADEIGKATVGIDTSTMDTKEIAKVQENIALLSKYGINAEKGIIGAMEAYRNLSKEQQDAFRVDLEPVLSAAVVETIWRGSKELDNVNAEVNKIIGSSQDLSKAAKDARSTWSATWKDIGNVNKNTLSVLQEQFAEAFGDPILGAVKRLSKYISDNKHAIRGFFDGIVDKASPVIEKVHGAIVDAMPDVKVFVKDVWAELKNQWQAVEPPARAVWDVVWGITKAVGGFLKEHPRLVATVISGIAAWKAYQLAASGVSVIKDVVGGAIKLTGGHIHRLNATLLENARLQGTFQTASMLASRMIGGIGRAALGAIPGIGAMGSSLIAAMMPALPVILPVIGAAAALGAAGYVVYRNWDSISDFFRTHFETIRNVLTLVFPPIGILIGLAGIVKDNWAGIKEMFSTIFETIRLAGQVAFEAIQYIGLSALSLIKDAWAGITGWFSGLWEKVKGVFTQSPLGAIFAPMVEKVKALVSPLVKFFSDVWKEIGGKAAEVIQSITGFFEGLNETLTGWFGGFKKENEKLREKLNLTSDVKAEITTPEMQAVERPDAPELTSPEIEKAEIEVTAPKDSIEQNTPVTATAEITNQTPVDVASSEAVSQLDLKAVTQDELVSIGLGQLSEIRKQTMLLESLKDDTIVEVLPVKPVERPEIESPVLDIPETSRIESLVPKMPGMPEIESPVLEMPSIPAINLTSASDAIQQQTPVPSAVATVEMPSVEMPVFESPQVEIDTPELVFEDYTLPSVPSDVEVDASLREGAPGTPEQNTSAPVTITNHFTIIQQPGQDPQDLARVVAEMVREQMDEETETYLVQ